MRATTITTAIMATTTGCWGIPQTTKPHRQQQRQQQQHYNVINNATCDGRWQPSPRMAAPAKCLVHHSRVKQHAAALDSAFFLLLPLLLLLLLATAMCRCSCNKLAKISVRCGVWWISSCLSDFDECLQYCTHTHAHALEMHMYAYLCTKPSSESQYASWGTRVICTVATDILHIMPYVHTNVCMDGISTRCGWNTYYVPMQVQNSTTLLT